MSDNKRRFGDRKDGRLVRSLAPISKMTAYIMPERNDALNHYEDRFEVTEVDRMLRKLRIEGYKGIGFLHFIIATYIRCIAMLPGVNRFVIGNRIYTHYDITINMMVKRSMSTEAGETAIKVHFSPTDTVLDVYKKMNEKIDEIKASDENNNTEQVADLLSRMPRFLLRFAVWLIRFADNHGWLPESLTEASPFHGSMIITDLGSLGIGPVYHHIYNLGTLSVFIAFGSKYRAYEINKHGTVDSNKYIDCKFVLDERIVDGHYYAQFLRAFKYIFKHPEIVVSPPSKVVEDIY